MKKLHAIILLLLWGLFLAGTIQAQEATETPSATGCPEIVAIAIEQTRNHCRETGQGQACYGYSVIQAQPRIGLLPDEFNFNEPGDTEAVTNFRSIQLSPMNIETDEWGVMELWVTTALPDGSTEDVQIVLFGDVELGDAVVFMEVTVTGNMNVNVRRYPTEVSDVIASLPPGERITANGRLDDNSWLRVRLSGEDGEIGWIKTEYVDLSGDINELTALTLDEAMSPDPTPPSPIQSIVLHTGVDDAPCQEAPNSGFLIQTPEGVGEIVIRIDEVVIQMDDNSTAFIQAGDEITTNVVEGSVQVTANGDTRTALEGMAIDVPLDEGLSPIGEPSDPHPYSVDTVTSLPTTGDNGLLLRPVTVPPPAVMVIGVPIEGNWLFSWGVEAMACPDGTVYPFESTGETGEIRVLPERLQWGATLYTQVTVGVYTASYVDENGNLHQDTLQVLAGDRISGEKTLDLVNPVCTLHVPFSLQLMSALP